MKKFLAIVLAALLAVTLISCAKDDVEENKTDVVEIYENVDLVAVADSLYDGIAEDQRPFVMSMPLTNEDFEFFTFVPYEEGLEAVANEPMMSSIAHSVVLVKAPTAEKAQELAAAMKENCDPRKWMCVEADIVEGVTNGNIAMLLMTTTEGGMSETILNNFRSLDAERIASLKSELVDGIGDGNEVIDDEFVDDELIEGEVETDAEDVVVELPEVDADNAPAVMPEEDNMPAVMPEVTPEVMPEVTPEVNTPAVEPEVEAPVETPIVETVPAEPEQEQAPVETPDVEAPAQDEAVTEPEEAPSSDVTIDTLYAIADKLYEGINPEDMPMVGTMELNSESFEYSAFVPYKDSYLAVESMPMMGSQPHSVVIVKADSEEEAMSLATEMRTNANPRKWICVSAKSVKSASKGNFAILVMTSVDVMPSDEIDEAKAEELSYEKSEERADIILKNFLSAVK